MKPHPQSAIKSRASKMWWLFSTKILHFVIESRLSLLWRLSPSKIHTYTCHHPQPRLLYGREVVVAVARDVVCLYIYAIFPIVPHHLAVHFSVRMIAVHPLLPSHAPRRRQLAPNLMVQAEHGLMTQIFRVKIERVHNLELFAPKLWIRYKLRKDTKIND